MLEQAQRVGKAAADCKLALDVEDYVATFRPDLMEGVSAWFKGATFAEVLKSTEIFEVGCRSCLLLWIQLGFRHVWHASGCVSCSCRGQPGHPS